MIEVRNLKYTQPGDMKFKVDRSTALGNPFRIDNKTTREQAIAKYEKWLRERLEKHDETKVNAYFNMLKDKSTLGDMTLLCHCWPQPCHAEVIIKLIEEAKAQEATQDAAPSI